MVSASPFQGRHFYLQKRCKHFICILLGLYLHCVIFVFHKTINGPTGPNFNKMKIDKDLLQKWAHLRSEDDTNKLAALTGKHPETIRKILRKGECSDEDFEIIAEFYDEKIDLINRYL